MTDLQTALQELHAARLREAESKSAVKAKREAFEATIASDVEVLAATTKTREAAEELVRGLAVAVYLETGSKAPAKGVSVIESSKLKYDPAEAFAWAKSEAKHLLVLDAKAFEKTAKATPLPFVTTETTPAARIATDLSDVA